MKDHVDQFSVEKMADILGISRSGYYSFLKRPLSLRNQINQTLCEKIRFIHQKNHETYGSPRIQAELSAQGERCSRKHIAKLMQQMGLKAKMVKQFKCKTTLRSSNPHYVAPDLIRQEFTADQPNEAWVSDITYIPTQEGWVYCAIILDLFSRMIVGLAVEASMTADLVTKALLQALKHRRPPAGVIHHSDQGAQYTSQAMQDLADYYGIQLSMGAVANAYDNAVAESFFHTLKTELVSFQHYFNLEEARMNIFQYVFGFYNQKRRHSTLGYLSPVSFESQFYQNRNLALS